VGDVAGKMILYTASPVTGYLGPAMRRSPKPFLLLTIFLLLLPATAGAVRVEDLYRADVKVADKGAEARQAGFREALERVLVKVSGSSAVLENESLQPVFERPSRHVQQYRYEELETEPEAEDRATRSAADGDDANGAASNGAEAEPLPRFRLRVAFARQRIDALLNERDIPVWDVHRPQVLVWLAFDDGRRRTLVAADDESGIGEALREVAARRGLPLLLPLLDMEDQRRVEYLDIQGGFLDRVRQASARYNAGLVLVGHVRPGSGGEWRGDWTLLEGDQRSGWLSRADRAAGVVAAGIGGLAERLAERFAGREGEQRRVRVRVEEAGGLDEYARLGRYFERLPRVDGQRVVRVRPNELLFELTLRGRLSDLERAIALDDLLLPVREEVGSTAAGVAIPTERDVREDEKAAGTDGDPDAPADDGSGPSRGPRYGFGTDAALGTGNPDTAAELVYRLAG